VVVPVILGEDAVISVKILANLAPYNYKLTKNGKHLQVKENQVSLGVH
jgi:hypothetical protein